MKFKLVLSKNDYVTLEPLMLAALQIFRRLDVNKSYTQLTLYCLMESLYNRIYGQSIFVQPKYKFSIPMAEALAFVAHWQGQPMKDIVTSELINRIIAQVDRLAVNYKALMN